MQIWCLKYFIAQKVILATTEVDFYTEAKNNDLWFF